MGLSKIKKSYEQTVIAFGDSGLSLGARTDLDDLAIMAHQSGDPGLKNLFEVLPPLAELQKQKFLNLMNASKKDK